MDPHLLRTFVTVARCGSFSQAARDLGYTQSAISQHISALETDLGVPLLERRPVRPTPAGARLLEHAGPLLLRLDAARADLARLTAAPAAGVTVGAAPLAMTARPAEALVALRRRRPNVAVSIRITARSRIPADVASGAVDLGLCDGIAAPNDPLHLPDTGPMTTVAVAQEPLAVAVPAGHPLAGRAGLDLHALVDAQWIDAPDAGVPLDQIRTVTGTGPFKASLHYAGTDVRGLLTLAATGHGLALLPHSAVLGLPGLVAVPITTPRLVHRTELLHGSIPAHGEDPASLLLAALTG